MTGKYDRRQFLVYGSAALGSSLLFNACANSPTTSSSPAPSAASPSAAPSASGFKAAMVLPGIITDKAWNQAGYTGLEEIKSKLGAETAYVEKVGQADQAEALSDFARRGFNLVYAHGGQFDAAAKQVAAQFPKTFFVVVNGAATGPNVASLRLDNLQISYLCGILAATVSKTGKLAYIAGQEFLATQEELRGYTLGAKSVKPTIKVSSTFTGDWNDAAKAKEAVDALVSAGADVVYPWLDNAAPTALKTAEEKGAYTIGNTVDQFDITPKSILTSAIKRIDLAIGKLADLSSKNELKGQLYSLGLEEPDILYLGKYGSAVPKALQDKVKTIEESILAKKITFESCSEGGKETRCVKGA
ncbi:BMP family protein [Stenomitos frigidus]|uniref:BMP family ABC transporter substrate-binding protein n=1 Tax=Stenomitos frigidus ULC18 TaxID=2107698 RepID=A0A2T1E2N5_9CYAN|nr:BMP family protein [Stenomitos frigidus]PSB27003.1 BMP family ABC transporter substrate-binding protein [Stenomitos frigidus ULC18]